jgi:hypothetical protein
VKYSINFITLKCICMKCECCIVNLNVGYFVLAHLARNKIGRREARVENDHEIIAWNIATRVHVDWLVLVEGVQV